MICKCAQDDGPPAHTSYRGAAISHLWRATRDSTGVADASSRTGTALCSIRCRVRREDKPLIIARVPTAPWCTTAPARHAVTAKPAANTQTETRGKFKLMRNKTRVHHAGCNPYTKVARLLQNMTTNNTASCERGLRALCRSSCVGPLALLFLVSLLEKGAHAAHGHCGPTKLHPRAD